MPLLKHSQYEFSNKELAIFTASHGGEERHVQLISEILNKYNYSMNDLDCGISKPMHEHTADKMLQNGISFSQANNTCSGKHTGMLLLLKHFNWPLKDYILIDHPVQQIMLETISEVCELDTDHIDIAIDGCGVPVFGMPLYNMALAYSKLDEDNTNFIKIKKAMTNQPYFVAGSERLDTIIMEETKGKILAKLGAESVYCMTILNQGIGIAVKIEDGSYRALDALIPNLLLKEGYISIEEHKNIQKRLKLNVYNHRHQIVGEIKSIL